MILVLPSDDALLTEVRRRVEALGWTSAVSAGAEQVVMVLSGGRDPEGLAEALRDRPQVDVLPVLTGAKYRRQRARRRFLTLLSLGLGLVTALGVAVPVIGFVEPPSEPLLPPEIVRVAKPGELPVGAARIVEFRGRPVIVVHRAEGRYYALDDRCTYMDECRLEWDAARGQITCPCHGCIYDVYGNVVHGPPSRPLPSYEAVQIGDAIYVRERS